MEWLKNLLYEQWKVIQKLWADWVQSIKQINEFKLKELWYNAWVVDKRSKQWNEGSINKSWEKSRIKSSTLS